MWFGPNGGDGGGVTSIDPFIIVTRGADGSATGGGGGVGSAVLGAAGAGGNGANGAIILTYT